MRWAALALLAAQALAPPALAEDYDPEVLWRCLDANDWSTCITVSADACLATEAGKSTPGIGYCYSEAWQHWDRLLNDAYRLAIAQAQELDADNAGGPLDLDSSEEALRTAQRAWIAFRDAACAYEGTRWSGGTARGPASVSCLMELTARQTIFLESRLW